jgi:hypothetical protein
LKYPRRFLFHLSYKDIFRAKTQDQAPFRWKIFHSRASKAYFPPKVLFIYRSILGVYNRCKKKKICLPVLSPHPRQFATLHGQMQTIQPTVFQMILLFRTFVCTLIDCSMKKLDYIRLSHSQANRKIWDGIVERYVTLRNRNRLPAILWIVVASLAFGGIAIIGWLASFFMVFKDLRYTPHYLRTVIVSLRMTGEQAHAFLDATLLDYKNRLSYGNISVK